MNIREVELFRLRNNTGTRSKGYKMAMNKFRLEIKKISNYQREAWIGLPRKAVGAKTLNKFKMELDTFMEGMLWENKVFWPNS